MNYFVIGDVHGCYYTFNNLISFRRFFNSPIVGVSGVKFAGDVPYPNQV
jgi:hypothetical protein